MAVTRIFETQERLLSALGIDGFDVCAVDLRLRPDELPTVTVTRILDHVDKEGELIKTLSTFELVLRPDPEPEA